MPFPCHTPARNEEKCEIFLRALVSFRNNNFFSYFYRSNIFQFFWLAVRGSLPSERKADCTRRASLSRACQAHYTTRLSQDVITWTRMTHPGFVRKEEPQNLLHRGLSMECKNVSLSRERSHVCVCVCLWIVNCVWESKKTFSTVFLHLQWHRKLTFSSTIFPPFTNFQSDTLSSDDRGKASLRDSLSLSQNIPENEKRKVGASEKLSNLAKFFFFRKRKKTKRRNS